MKAYRWSDVARNGEAFHLVRGLLRGANATRAHTHDFPELFWIEQGRGTHRINGRTFPMEAGNLVFIRAADHHALSSDARTGFVLVNFAFPAATLDFLAARYFKGANRWFWKPGPVPEILRLDRDHLSRLSHWVDSMAGGHQSRLEGELFLLELLRELAEGRAAEEAGGGPEWLVKALQHRATPEVLAGGTAALARLAGRTPQHLNATLKRWRGVTATDAVNEARMDVAARELRTSTKKIIEICLDCGLENLAHFYRLFHHRFGTTPRRYRARHQALVR